MTDKKDLDNYYAGTVNLSSEPTQWLTIKEASHILKMSQSALRRWTGRGVVPSYRTAGGHRRYLRQSVEEIVQKRPGPSLLTEASPSYPLESPGAHLSAENLSRQPWHPRLSSPDTTKDMRALGQRILGLLIQYTTRPRDDSRFLEEANEAGTSYGTLAATSGATFRDSVEAFIFFRESFSRISLQPPRVSLSSDASEIIRMTERINRFMDTVLLGLVSGYEAVVTRPSLSNPPSMHVEGIEKA